MQVWLPRDDRVRHVLLDTGRELQCSQYGAAKGEACFDEFQHFFS